MAPRKLFEEFPPVSTKAWEEQLNADLNGGDYEKKLIWRTPEGFRANPYYRSEHLTDKEYLNALPGEYPYIRGNKTSSNQWEIRQDIKLDDIATANLKSLFILDRGITSLGFITDPHKETCPIKDQESFSRLLKDIYIDCIYLYFVCGYNASHILKLLSREAVRQKLDPGHILGAVDYDPLGYLTIHGNFCVSEEEDFKVLSDLTAFAEKNLPAYKVLAINGYFLHNAGANCVQEIAYSLSMAAEYLTILSKAGFSVDAISRHLQFNLGVGSSYFMEIAKIRAFRFLWSKMVEAFKPVEEASKTAFIHSICSEWNQTIYDPYVNVLRATTESMAAVIGGTDTLSVRPFTYSYKSTNKFSGRLSRNIQIILREEAYLGNIVDPAAGSYYIENLTDSLIREAWQLFLKTEDDGGYLESIKKGIIQTDIQRTAEDRLNRLATRRETLVGINQYADPSEKMKDEIHREIAFPKDVPGNTPITPVRRFRGAMKFEKLRLATEQHSHPPRVFLLTIGNLTMRKARAAFSSNFFSCAGYEILDNHGFDSVKDGVSAALKAKADILVVCSSDEEYAEHVPRAKDALKDRAILVVAGAPPCMDDLKAKGIELFIHMHSNILESLTAFHRMLNIKSV